ncbi:hypothetical protein OOT00_16100 [Desulfobotulus sp. H1]|uniref:Uncharacterized protein n=1 Tax=Desulfobotulus pelophilus TaxID=2823377 RepID=A0ABT3NDF9_9BACT|nr:hypothetical protein [Desulfobotulus pelophilus]MCW7755498.1 hypothetical protein [Desulfobotulus pelophilus]
MTRGRGDRRVKMAYVASRNGRTYAICSADPDCAADLADNLKAWCKEGAEIELLPASKAKGLFCSGLPQPEHENQMSLFGEW